MAWTALAIAAVVVATFAGLGAAWLRRGSGTPTADWVVEPVRLGNHRERILFANLRAAFPDNPVMLHVSLAKLLRLRRSHGSTRAFLRYFRMSAPFVVCSKDLMPIVVVDPTGTPDAPRVSREREARAAVLRAAGLIYLPVTLDARAPSPDDLRQLVRTALQARSHGAKPKAGASSTPASATTAAAHHVVPGVPPATALTTGALPRRTSAAPPFPKPAVARAPATPGHPRVA